VVAGPAGVGKTRLAEECARLAESSGFAVVWVLATREAGAIPFGALGAVLPPWPASVTQGVDALRWAADALVGEAAMRPTVLVVDDAHLIDGASATVVQQLALGGRAFVAVTVRSGETTPEPIVALWKDGLAERVDLAPLSPREVEQLAGVALGGRPSGAAAAELWRVSEGNSLFLRELILAGVESGRLVCEGNTWHLRGSLSTSARLIELIQSRLGALTPPDIEVLQLVAYGEPIGAALVESLTTAAAVEAVERCGLIGAERRDRREELRLAHPLYGDAVRDAMSPSQVRRVCGRLADAIERLGARRHDDVLRVAAWQLHDGRQHDAGKLLAAARQARGMPDLELAKQLVFAARQAGGGFQAAHLMANVMTEAGHHEEAERLFVAATAEAASDEERAVVAMGRSTNLFAGLGQVDAAIALDSAALDEVTEQEWLDEIVAHRATFELLRGRPGAALVAVGPLLASSHGRPFAQAAIVAVPASVVTGRSVEAARLAEVAFAAHSQLGDQPELSHPAVHLVARVFALREAGRLAEAQALGELGYHGSVEVRSTLGQAYFALQLAGVWLAQGRTRSACELSAEAAGLFGDLALPARRRWCHASGCLAAAVAGDVAESDRLLAAVDAVPPAPEWLMEAEVDRARAWNAAAHGEVTRARTLLTAGIERATEQGAAGLLVGLVHDLARLGAPQAAASMTDVLSGLEGEFTPLRLAHVTALAQRDGEGLDATAAGFAGVGAFLLAAEAAADAARAHERANSHRLAMASGRRSHEWVARCEGARTPALVESGQFGRLTEREREVAALAAAGLGNRAIADRLYLSLRTVENHLARVYDKLGIAGRDDLASALPEPHRPV
jgi:DNA-binding CsgD family transcriptional regulator